MKKIPFTKMVASGNDFVVVDSTDVGGARLAGLAQAICDRKFGAGADGMLLLEKTRKADVRMRVFNADGSEANMCGNGARCVALYRGQHPGSSANKEVTIETKAGLIASVMRGQRVRVRLTGPRGIREESLKLGARKIKVHFVDTGVPHAVIFVEGLAGINVRELGRAVRNHAAFAPRGANVNFVEVRGPCSIAVRTYERGVEDETLACGTGSAAGAIIFALQSGCQAPVEVTTQSGEVLAVYFSRDNASLSDVWLEGKARIVYEGIYQL